MATEKRMIEIPNDGIVKIPIMMGADTVGEKVIDLRHIPTVDAVEVVRCENCQYWNPRYETMGMCMKHNSIVTFTKPDFFCAWGKDKNDGICKKG